ncbi:MAG: serine hydrolase [Thermoanaerobaculia bacterium]
MSTAAVTAACTAPHLPVASLQVSGRLNDGTETGYGGGLRLTDYRGLRTIGHDGLDGGYVADVVAFPDQRLAIAVLCNGGTIVPRELSRKVADVYLGHRLSPDAPLPCRACCRDRSSDASGHLIEPVGPLHCAVGGRRRIAEAAGLRAGRVSPQIV